ncbi:hypothetical protein TNCV_3293931 [Trichonephila clavipes]|nr:hypothetical protein TNCV_3293931 [Trichonephila clavipes]
MQLPTDRGKEPGDSTTIVKQNVPSFTCITILGGSINLQFTVNYSLCYTEAEESQVWTQDPALTNLSAFSFPATLQQLEIH